MIWTNGVVLDVHALKERTGLPIVVDGAQSVGAIDVDVGAIDYYTVSGQKWLCGPESTGALYIADADALRVARPGYFAQQSFEPGGRYVPREGAQRFDPGWISVASLKGFATALGLAPEWRFERIAEAAARCREALAERVRVVTPPGQAGLVTFEVEGDPEAVVAQLLVGERGRPQHPRHEVAPRVVRLVDERRRHRPPSRGSVGQGRTGHGRGLTPAMASADSSPVTILCRLPAPPATSTQATYLGFRCRARLDRKRRGRTTCLHGACPPGRCSRTRTRDGCSSGSSASQPVGTPGTSSHTA